MVPVQAAEAHPWGADQEDQVSACSAAAHTGPRVAAAASAGHRVGGPDRVAAASRVRMVQRARRQVVESAARTAAGASSRARVVHPCVRGEAAAQNASREVGARECQGLGPDHREEVPAGSSPAPSVAAGATDLVPVQAAGHKACPPVAAGARRPA